MINITELKSKKCIGKTSLFLSFNYSPEIVNIIKECGDAVWHKDLLQWELPCNKLSQFIEKTTFLDNIQLNILEDEQQEEIELIQDYKTKPFDYQKDGIKWLLNNPNSLLLDPPGLGKTLQIIYLCEELKSRNECNKVLILCGINSLKTNWKKEIQRHSKYDGIIIGEKINSKGRVSYTSIRERAEQLYQPIDEMFVILNVESLRDSLVVDAIKDSKNKFDIIVFDEVHKAKSPTSQQGKNLLKLRTVGKRHIGLTGTVLVNSPLDAYVPLKFIGRENSTYTNFKQFYCVYEQKFGHNQITGYKNLDVLKDEINECSLRRSKDLLNLPPKIIVPEYLEMDVNHQKFYDDLCSGVVEEADRVNIKPSSLLGLVTRLRQASTCPELLTSSDMSNVKLDRTCDLVEEIVSNGEKVVIFSTFKEPLYRLQELLKQYKSLICTGDQADAEISKDIDKFQNDDNYRVMLATTAKMGTGITLTAASYEIFIDSSWTDALETQVEDRCWRIGSKKNVIIYKLICKGTIDEKVQRILERKRAISDYVVDDKMTNEVEELKELLGIM